jgi:hypothetical protein
MPDPIRRVIVPALKNPFLVPSQIKPVPSVLVPTPTGNFTRSCAAVTVATGTPTINQKLSHIAFENLPLQLMAI